MIPYERLIIQELKGETPREKYNYFKSLESLLRKVGWPRRGTEEDSWDIYDVAEMAREFVTQSDEFEKGREE